MSRPTIGGVIIAQRRSDRQSDIRKLDLDFFEE
jgi:hypothetical protein